MSIRIGTVVTGSAGSAPIATLTGAEGIYTLNLSIPQGRSEDMYDDAYRMNVEWDIAHEDGVAAPLLDGAL